MSSVGHPLGEHLLAEVDRLVTELRSEVPGELDIAELAAVLGIVVREEELAPSLHGLTLDDRRVLLQSGLGRGRVSFVFAHELAHVLCRRSHFRTVRREDEEWFADWFARELLLPRRWLSSHGVVALMSQTGAGFDVVALQLAAVGLAPSVMRHRDAILCRVCGTEAYRWRCACRAWRHALRRNPDVLPDAGRDLWLSLLQRDEAQYRLHASGFAPPPEKEAACPYRVRRVARAARGGRVRADELEELLAPSQQLCFE